MTPTPTIYPESIGGFRLLRQVGLGSSAWVFEATAASGSRVALKLFHPHIAAGTTFQQNFEREVEIATQVSSEFTARVLGAGSDEGWWFIASEFFERSLSDVLAIRGSLTTEESCKWGEEIALALADLHRQGIIHRDIKPSNVMLDSSGCAKVADYGLSRVRVPRATTSSLHFAGSLPYCAPEQASGRSDERSDIYALGATVCEMLTGSPPERHGLLLALPSGLGRTLTEQLAGVDQRIVAIVSRALAVNPEERYASAATFAQNLHSWRRAPPLEATPSREWNRRTWISIGTALAAAVVTLGTLALGAAGRGDGHSSGTRPGPTQETVREADCTVSAPQKVSATQGGTGEVLVSWVRADTCSAAGHVLAYSTRNDRASVPSTQVFDLGFSTGSNGKFLLTNLELGKAIYVWVEAYGASRQPIGDSHAEIVPGVTCEKAPAPLAGQITAVTSSSLSVGWQSGGGCTTGYFVYYSISEDIRSVEGGLRAASGILDTGDKQSATIGGLLANRSYSVWIYAYGPGDTQSAVPFGPLGLTTAVE